MRHCGCGKCYLAGKFFGPIFSVIDLFDYLDFLRCKYTSGKVMMWSDQIDPRVVFPSYAPSGITIPRPIELHYQWERQKLIQSKIRSLVDRKRWIEISQLLSQPPNDLRKPSISNIHYAINLFIDTQNCFKMREKRILLKNGESYDKNKSFGYNFEYRKKILELIINKKFGKKVIQPNCIELIFQMERQLLLQTPSHLLTSEFFRFCEKNVSLRKKNKHRKNKYRYVQKEPQMAFFSIK